MANNNPNPNALSNLHSNSIKNATNNAQALGICVIIAVYQKPRELQQVLESLAQQTVLPAQVIVTEDNVSDDIPAVVAAFKDRLPMLSHLSQLNQGFGKCKALNRAIAQAVQPLLLFTDGDCLFRNDFIATHQQLACAGHFVTGGGHINIAADFHAKTDLTPHIRDQSVFTDRFFKHNACGKPRVWRFAPPRGLKAVLNALTRRNALNGCNACVWRDDVLKVAGFDEAMGYGAEDLNLGVRLNNIGVTGRSYRYSLPHVHLDHARSYKHQATVLENVAFNRSITGSAQALPRQSSLL